MASNLPRPPLILGNLGRLKIGTGSQVLRPDIGAVAPALVAPRAVDLLRTEDLLLLRCAFVNMAWGSDPTLKAPVLVRNIKTRPAFMVVTMTPQHIVEEAFFETSKGIATGKTNPPGKDDPDKNSGIETLKAPPVFASIAGATRLVFQVTNQQIVYTTEGLLRAMSELDLVVAPHAAPPPPPLHFTTFQDSIASGLLDVGSIFRVEGFRDVATTTAAADVRRAGALTAGVQALARAHRSAAVLERRFGPESALLAISAVRVGQEIDIGQIIGIGPLLAKPPLPSMPTAQQTTIELPWRLIVSPNNQGAWAHSAPAVTHDGRTELWHSRLGVRAKDKDGKPVVDELSTYYRTMRAIWARDFAVGTPPTQADLDFGRKAFHSPPVTNDFPTQNPKDNPPHTVRTTLNSRDRMMLVHETSNFHLTKFGGNDWAPPAVPVEQMMLSSLGGWLKSRVEFKTLPQDSPLSIEEWKHRAAMGRDHEVKVVYAGFLAPFGHRASLVKLTERKIAQNGKGPVAYLFQRMFIVVREFEKAFSSTVLLEGGFRADHVMPLKTVRILTTVTPDLDDPTANDLDDNPFLFVPYVGGSPFPFKIVALDGEGNLVEFQAPLCFLERGHNQASFDNAAVPGLKRATTRYNTNAPATDKQMPLGGQHVAFAPSADPDDTALATQNLVFDILVRSDAAGMSQDVPRFLPALHETDSIQPAMSALAGQAATVKLRYPDKYKKDGFTGNKGEVFLELVSKQAMEFAGQGDRSGGLVTPSINVSALSRMTGPIGGNPTDAINGDFKPANFFAGVKAKLFGVVALTDLLKAVGFDPSTVPTFVAKTLDAATTLMDNARRLLAAAQQVEAAAGAAATELKNALNTFVNHLEDLFKPGGPPDLAADLTAIAGKLQAFIDAVNGLEQLPRPSRVQITGIAQQMKQQVDNAAEAAALLQQLARGELVPEVVTARLDWSTDIPRWPSGSVDNAILSPVNDGGTAIENARLTLAIEVQAPTKPGREPSALISCSISPVDLRLIGPALFLILHFKKLEFSVEPGKKPDVNVVFDEDDGIEFAGCLSFVNTLKDYIPFNGFSDPPYLDVTSSGVKAGFDLSIPSIGVGVMSLENIALGAHFSVPFIDESLEVGFNFCTREDPFRLTVMLFGGGGFFGITLTPNGVRILEASFEFGAAISINLGVASGGVSIMAGIYFKLEMVDGHTDAVLSGYFRLRGEVDVLGLISASIELYLEFTYETATGKAVGRATLTIEISIFFLSFSVEISCEKKFAGANGDPSFADQMGLPPGAPPAAVRPWDLYCRAFAEV